MIVQYNRKSLKIITKGSNGKNDWSDDLRNYLILNGWGIRIRTLINGVRVRCPTIERFPSKICLKAPFVRFIIT